MTDFLTGPTSAISTFTGRDIYDEQVRDFYRAINKTDIEPNSLDSLGQRGLYGRVNRTNEAVIPNTQKIISVIKGKKEYFGFDFVLDAWFDFLSYYEPIARQFNIPFNFDNTSLQTKHIFSQEYQIYILPTLERINAKLSSKFIDKYHMTQNKYKTLFYSVSRSEDYSINPKKFLFSHSFNPATTCLAIETAKESFVNDAIKVKKFWTNDNFTLYVESARRYGFLVDSFAPWRLFVDLNSVMISYYIKRRSELYRIQDLIAAGNENATRELNEFMEEFDPAKMEDIEQVHLDTIFDKYFVPLDSQVCLLQDAANAGFSLFVG